MSIEYGCPMNAEGAVNGHQRVVKLGANTANTAALRNESLCME